MIGDVMFPKRGVLQIPSDEEYSSVVTNPVRFVNNHARGSLVLVSVLEVPISCFTLVVSGLQAVWQKNC